ncbi:RING finger protein [Oscillospiraceae bacterium LTW-04]|nr:RING finger protein [Oscillospiraceae bacterium MB24-C1]
MSRYTGLLCESCKKAFTDDDDIVVCPDCGAPHHRNCYESQGHCELQDKHSDKFVWQAHRPDAENEQNQAPSKICPNCNAANPSQGRYCQMCGSPLENAGNASSYTANAHGQYNNSTQDYRAQPDSGFNYNSNTTFEHWDINGISSQEISAYTGSGSYYFLRQFKLILRTQFNMSWNWSALIFNYFYFFYRKMYKVGFALLGFYIVSSIPTLLCYFEPTDATISMMGVTIAYNSHLATKLAPLMMILDTMRLFLRIWCTVFANKLYLKNTLQNIRNFKNESGISEGTPEYYSGLYYHGRPNRLAAILIGFGLFTVYSVLMNFFTWSMV